MRLRVHVAAVFVATTLLTAPPAQAYNGDPVGSIYAAAQNHGVDPRPLLRVAWCESRFDPLAHTRDGHYHGLYMLGDVPTGLLGHFHSLGYDSAYDAEQAADYMARVLAGEFLPTGTSPAPLHPYGIVSVRRWSCWDR